jgi:N-acetylneuraminic acid mutarotase
MKKTPLLTLAACLVGLLSQAPAVSADDNKIGAPESSPWLRLADMPQSKEQFGLEACEGKIYAIAGICNGEETTSCFVYDTNEGRWSPMAPLPKRLQSPCVRAVKGRLLCFAGYDHATAIKFPDVFLYDPNANAWRSRAPMAIPREDGGSAILNGQVWLISGLTQPGHKLIPEIDVYDPDLNVWLPPFTIKPHDADWPGRALGDFGCTVGNTIWCLGGTENTANYPRLQPSPLGFFFNATDLGYIVIPDPRCYAEVEPIGNHIYVVGGCRTSTTDYADTMLVLNAETQIWEKPVLQPYSARGPGACSWNGALYLAGGYDGRTRSDFYLWMDEDQPRIDVNQPTIRP